MSSSSGSGTVSDYSYVGLQSLGVLPARISLSIILDAGLDILFLMICAGLVCGQRTGTSAELAMHWIIPSRAVVQPHHVPYTYEIAILCRGRVRIVWSTIDSGVVLCQIRTK